MSYVDGFLIAVPTANRQKYLDMAKVAAEVFKEHGATRVVECWGDDVPEGKVTSFPMAVKRNDDETVVFSWVEWPSKEVREAGNEKVMKDPRMSPEAFKDQTPPFDGQRMIFGGFQPILDS